MGKAEGVYISSILEALNRVSIMHSGMVFGVYMVFRDVLWNLDYLYIEFMKNES